MDGAILQGRISQDPVMTAALETRKFPAQSSKTFLEWIVVDVQICVLNHRIIHSSFFSNFIGNNILIYVLNYILGVDCIAVGRLFLSKS